MQKKLIALAIAAAASGAAFAQTNVQIYGIADVGYVGVDRDHFKYQNNINSGVLSTSRIGFKGAEDLGNGLKAIFTLEYGLEMDNNTGIGATSAAARQQFVGLTGGFGTVVAGRLQTAGLDFTVAGSALGGSTSIGATNLVSQSAVYNGGTNPFPLLNAASRANNAVAYISPSFGGVTVAFNHARMTESAASDDLTDQTANLLAVNYDGGPLTAGLVYGKLSNGKSAGTPDMVVITGAPPAPGGNVQGFQVDATDPAKTKNSGSTEWGVRAGYDFGVVKLQAAYQQAKLGKGMTGFDRDAKNKRWVVSATVPVTAKIAVIGEYAQAKNQLERGESDDKNKAFTLAATYSLSKRTTAYAAFARQTFNNKEYDSADKFDSYRLNTNIYGIGLRHAF